jgi:hypothetical protein
MLLLLLLLLAPVVLGCTAAAAPADNADTAVGCCRSTGGQYAGAPSSVRVA